VIINEILTAPSNQELDEVLARCCEAVLDGQAADPDFYGLVGACVVMPNGNKVYGVSYHDETTGQVVHAERAALDRCDGVDANCVMVTTLSPCNERHDETAEERYGESCEDLIADSGIQHVYCGYKDFTQDHSDSTVTENPKLQELCKQLSDTFLKENFADGKKPGRKGLAKRSGVNTKASVSSLRKTAKNSSGEKARMAHWLANMKSGRAKAKKK
jgi:pyrimidine deaminase RibD-like protein